MSNKNLTFPGFNMFIDDMPFGTWFGDFVDRMQNRLAAEASSPKPRYYTNKDGSELYVELPGCKKEDVSVEFDENEGVIVRATREVAGKKDSFRMSFKPECGGIDPESIKPKFADGLLTIPVQEKKQETKRRIAIE